MAKIWMANFFGSALLDHDEEYLQQIRVGCFAANFVLKYPEIGAVLLEGVPEILLLELVKLCLSFKG